MYMYVQSENNVDSFIMHTVFETFIIVIKHVSWL